LKQAGSTPNREAALFYIRQRLQPLVKTLAELPANERGPALREALDLLGQPNAEPAIRRLSAEYIAKGTQPQIAFQEALARVLATAFLVVAPVQYLAEQGAAQDVQGLDGIGDFFSSVGRGIKKGAKAVGKAAMKVVHKVVDLYEDVACSSVGKAVADKAGQALVGAPPGAGGTAVCSSAKMSEYLTAEVAHAVGAKKKNPSFKAYAKAVGAEIVAGVGRATDAAGGMGGALTQIKLPNNLQKISDDIRSKVDNNKILTFTRKELESKVPGVKKLSKEQLDVVTTQIADRAATPEAYGDKPRDTVLVGTPPKKAKPREKSAYEQALEAAKQREAAKTPADRAREKAEGERWRKENAWRYASSAKNPTPMPNLRPVGPQIPDMQPAAPKSSKMPLILLGVGVVGALCPDEAPLLGFVSVMAPAIAMGNTCVLVPSQSAPLSATDFYQVLETSDLPAGVVNIVTGAHGELAKTLAGHLDVDGVWSFSSTALSERIETDAAGNLKRTWVNHGRARNWFGAEGEGREFLRHATEIKTIWVPYGE
jgi:hypothetical protein